MTFPKPTKQFVLGHVVDDVAAWHAHEDRPWERITVYQDTQALDPAEGHEGARTSDPDLWSHLMQQRRAWEAGQVYRIGLEFFTPTGTRIGVSSPVEQTFLVGEWREVDVITEQYLGLIDDTPEQIAAQQWTGWDTPSPERNQT